VGMRIDLSSFSKTTTWPDSSMACFNQYCNKWCLMEDTPTLTSICEIVKLILFLKFDQVSSVFIWKRSNRLWCWFVSPGMACSWQSSINPVDLRCPMLQWYTIWPTGVWRFQILSSINKFVHWLWRAVKKCVVLLHRARPMLAVMG